MLRPYKKYTVVVAILLLAMLMQTRLLAQEIRFHGDEAFFMHFARNAAVNGDWLLSGSLDKPPVLIYLNAAALIFFAVDHDEKGVAFLDVYKGEFSARVTGIFLALVMLAAMMQLAERFYRDTHAMLLCGVLLALSPFVIVFAPTAFMDMPMLCFAVLCLVLMQRQKVMWAGLFFALAFAAKPQAIFFLPVVLCMGLSYSEDRCRDVLLRVRRVIRNNEMSASPRALTGFIALAKKYLKFAFACGAGIVLLLLWDTARPETSVFLLGASNNSPESWLTASSDWLPRFADWWRYLRELTGNDALTLFVLMFITISVFARRRLQDIFLWLWLLVYLLLHIALRFNIYDRYLLLLVPGFVLLLAQGILWLIRLPRFSHYSILIVSLVMVLLIPAAWQAAAGRVPIGGDRGDYAGIDELTAYLNEKPVATIIYDRWLGWELDYYMGQWSDKRRVYFPTIETFVEGVLAVPETEPRYFIAPVAAEYQEWLQALTGINFEIHLDKRFPRFVVYALIPPRNPA